MGHVMFLRKGEVHTAPKGSSDDDSEEGTTRKGWC